MDEEPLPAFGVVAEKVSSPLIWLFFVATPNGQKTNNINNEDAVVEMDTEIHVAMEMKLGKVSLNDDICKSW